MVFEIKAEEREVGEVKYNQLKERKLDQLALKINYNLGMDTSLLATTFMNEFNVLHQLQRAAKFHKNVIRYYHYFEAPPSDPFFDHFPPDTRKLMVFLIHFI